MNVTDARILVNQIGWLPTAPKVAILRQPKGGASYTPGQIQVVDALSNAVRWSGTAVQWNGGAVHGLSGDRCWRLDFSALQTPGTYRLIDTTNGDASATFRIATNVYTELLRLTTRVFFHQRANVAKSRRHAGNYAIEADATRANQDPAARSILTPTSDASARNVTGGWWDAGDTNKYVTFAEGPVHQLLEAYERRAALFTDKFGIPESGNGIPDVLSEIKVELDWILKMQDTDGGVFIKVGVTTPGPGGVASPDLDTRPRYYGRKSSAATLATAGMLAHAAIVLGTVSSWATYATTLQSAAVKAWQWTRNNPKTADADPVDIQAGDADRPLDRQNASELVAAIYLYALTSQQSYHDFVIAKFAETNPPLNPWKDYDFGRYQPHEGQAALYYLALPATRRNEATASRIQKRFFETCSWGPAYGATKDDPYGVGLAAGDYNWGSNQVVANLSRINAIAADLAAVSGIAASRVTECRIRAQDALDYLCGKNPLNLCYFTNLAALGVENSVQRLFHYQFGKGDYAMDQLPAPGYVVGGANGAYAGDLPRPAEPMRSYLDDNGSNDADASGKLWQFSEPGIYYQSAAVGAIAMLS